VKRTKFLSPNIWIGAFHAPYGDTGMADYRRWYINGGTYFFTLVTYQRRPLFKDPAARKLLGDLMRQQADQMPFQTVAIVLLWDHLHCLWTLLPEDDDYSTRWKEIKSVFTRNWLRGGGNDRSVSRSKASRGRRGVWQPRFYEHTIRDEQDLENHADYIHFNPVKHGYVKRPWDWQWSSFRSFVESGQYSQDWGTQGEPTNICGMNRE
jgi:putative transposase